MSCHELAQTRLGSRELGMRFSFSPPRESTTPPRRRSVNPTCAPTRLPVPARRPHVTLSRSLPPLPIPAHKMAAPHRTHVASGSVTSAPALADSPFSRPNPSVSRATTEAPPPRSVTREGKNPILIPHYSPGRRQAPDGSHVAGGAATYDAVPAKRRRPTEATPQGPGRALKQNADVASRLTSPTFPSPKRKAHGTGDVNRFELFNALFFLVSRTKIPRGD